MTERRDIATSLPSVTEHAPKLRGSIQGQLLRLSTHHTVAIYLRQGSLWVADFIDDQRALIDANAWFRFNCGSLANSHARRRMALESAIPLRRISSRGSKDCIAPPQIEVCPGVGSLRPPRSICHSGSPGRPWRADCEMRAAARAFGTMRFEGQREQDTRNDFVDEQGKPAIWSRQRLGTMHSLMAALEATTIAPPSNFSTGCTPAPKVRLTLFGPREQVALDQSRRGLPLIIEPLHDRANSLRRVLRLSALEPRARLLRVGSRHRRLPTPGQ